MAITGGVRRFNLMTGQEPDATPTFSRLVVSTGALYLYSGKLGSSDTYPKNTGGLVVDFKDGNKISDYEVIGIELIKGNSIWTGHLISGKVKVFGLNGTELNNADTSIGGATIKALVIASGP